jgi:hypothetical protein
MGLAQWFLSKLGDDETRIGDPDQVVEAGLVALAVSQIVVMRLGEEGIDATAQEERHFGRMVRIKPMARILVRLGDLDRARPIIDEVSDGW